MLATVNGRGVFRASGDDDLWWQAMSGVCIDGGHSGRTWGCAESGHVYRYMARQEI
jgi:hypothetical protein